MVLKNPVAAIEKPNIPRFLLTRSKNPRFLGPFVAEGSSRLYLKLGNSHLC